MGQQTLIRIFSTCTPWRVGTSGIQIPRALAGARCSSGRFEASSMFQCPRHVQNRSLLTLNVQHLARRTVCIPRLQRRVAVRDVYVQHVTMVAPSSRHACELSVFAGKAYSGPLPPCPLCLSFLFWSAPIAEV